MPSARPLRFALVVAIVSIATAALGWALTRRAPPPLAQLAHVYPETVAAHDHDAALRGIDARIAGAAPLLAAHPGDWLEQENQAQRLMSRARLTGDFGDYAAADAAIKTGFAHAAQNTGPHLTAANFAMMVHRLGAAQTLLDALSRYVIPPDAGTRAEAEAMRGDIAFYRGDYAAARGAYDRAKEISGGPDGQGVRVALLLSKTGDPDGALTALDRALRAGRFIAAQNAAQLHYQRGMIELGRGHWAEAEAEFGAADRLFGGQWHYIQARAQSRALAGDTIGAIALYELAIRSANNPETMDALAALYRAQGNRPQAEEWARRAGAIWARWLAMLPEAAVGHALDHELSFGSPPRALALAQMNWAARPYGGSAVALAWALIANARAAEAAATIERVNASGWVSAEQHMAGARAFELLGNTGKASSERAAALALNPRAYDRAAGVIWIGH